MIDQVELMQVIEKMRSDTVVIPTMRANVGWVEVSHNIRRDMPVSGAMGKASSFALGLCLAQPDTKVVVFDGDGSLLMNLGALVTVANKAPRNLYHFVLDNGVYATTGGQPVPGADFVDYAGMGRAAGYTSSYAFDNLEDFVTQAEQIFSQEGPVLVAVKTVPNIRPPQERAATRGAPARRTSQAIPDLMEEFGVVRR